MRVHFINILIVLALIAGGVILQIVLSKKENKWLGLILPLISFVISLLFVFNISVGNLMYTGKTGVMAVLVLQTLVLCNIPTAILLAIYFVCRDRKKRKKEIEKMNIQDLK